MLASGGRDGGSVLPIDGHLAEALDSPGDLNPLPHTHCCLLRPHLGTQSWGPLAGCLQVFFHACICFSDSEKGEGRQAWGGKAGLGRAPCSGASSHGNGLARSSRMDGLVTPIVH